MLFEARDLKKEFKSPRVRAVDGVSLSVAKGKTLGIVGESGSGKSTLAKLLLGLIPADGGEVFFKGNKIRLNRPPVEFRRKLQIVFQDPFLSLDPRHTVRKILAEPFRIHGQRDRAFIDKKIPVLLDSVELGTRFLDRRPHELSGGECQRVAIARAISLDPELLICDEAVSALDALVRAGILNLFLKLQKERRLSLIFISHDLKVVRHMSDDILVMKDGRACESGPSETIFYNPQHPYTQSLLAASRLS